MGFNNKEYAVIITIALFVLWLLCKARESFWEFFSKLFQKILIKIYILMISYAIIITYVLYKLNFWQFEFLKATILWFLISGLYLAFVTGGEREVNVRKIIPASFFISLIVDYITGLSCYSILTELGLLWLALISLLFIVAIDVNSATAEEHTKTIRNFFAFIVIIIFLNNLKNGFLYIVKDKGESFSYRELLLPFIYTITFLPFCYLLAVYSQYELTFIKIGYPWVKKGYLKTYLLIRLLVFFNFNLGKLKKVHEGEFYNSLLGSDSFSNINKNIKKIKNKLKYQ
jgi:hypothetical protein